MSLWKDLLNRLIYGFWIIIMVSHKSHIKEKVLSASGSVSGAASILGSWQICHNVCLGIVALLSIIGITVVGMPLAFLTSVAIPFWTFALMLLIVTIILYVKKKCISSRLIMFNAGLIIAGIPFQSFQRFSVFFWIFGGIIALFAVGLFINDKMMAKKRKGCHKRGCHEN